MFKFLHAADIHLDSPLRNLKSHQGLNVETLQSATRRAFVNLIDLAIAEQVKFVLIAGDVYDGDSRDFGIGLWLHAQFQRLADHKIQVFLIRGNHDAQNRVLRDFKFSAHVHQLPTNKPDTITLEDVDVAIHGQGFAQASVTDDLSTAYPRAKPGLFNIGLLHTSATGFDGHEPYAPCQIDTLRSKGYGYWALGHVHTRLTLEKDETHVVFPGNTQGRHIRETGPKGCVLVTVTDKLEVECEFRAIDVVRWERLELDGSTCENIDALVDQFSIEARSLLNRADDRSSVVRIEVTGASPGHEQFLAKQSALRTNLLAEAGRLSDQLWIEKIKLNTLPVIAARREDIDNDAYAAVLETIEQLRGNDNELAELSSALFAGLKKKLPDDLIDADGVRLNDIGWLREALASVWPVVLDEFNAPTDAR